MQITRFKRWLALVLVAFSCSGFAALAAEPPVQPGTLTITRKGKKVSLKWTIDTGDARFQSLFRDVDNDPKGRTQLSSVYSDDRKYADVAPDEKKDYWYWVRYTDSHGAFYEIGPVLAPAVPPPEEPKDKPKRPESGPR